MWDWLGQLGGIRIGMEKDAKMTSGKRLDTLCPKCGWRLWELKDPEGKVWQFCYICYNREKEDE